MTDIEPEWVEKAARAAFDDGLMRYAPEHVARWDDEHDEGIRESWRVVARAAIAAVIDDIRAEALHKAATAYQMGGWAKLPQASGDLPTKRRQAEHAVKWLRDRAKGIEQGGAES